MKEQEVAALWKFCFALFASRDLGVDSALPQPQSHPGWNPGSLLLVALLLLLWSACVISRQLSWPRARYHHALKLKGDFTVPITAVAWNENSLNRGCMVSILGGLRQFLPLFLTFLILLGNKYTDLAEWSADGSRSVRCFCFAAGFPPVPRA